MFLRKSEKLMFVLLCLISFFSVSYCEALAPLSDIGKKENILSQAFAYPALFRRVIKNNIKLPVSKKYKDKASLYVSLTDRCPVGCDGCFFASQMLKKNPDNTFTKERLKKLFAFTKKANIRTLTISGGGEPFLEMDAILEIIKKASCDELIIITSGFWAKNKTKAKKDIDLIYRTLEETNKIRAANGKEALKIGMRLSVDDFHSKKVSFKSYENILNIFVEDYFDLNNKKEFYFFIRSVIGDETVDKFLSGMDTIEDVKKNTVSIDKSLYYFKAKETGKVFEFKVRHVHKFNPDLNIDLYNVQKATINNKLFNDRYSKDRGYKAVSPDGKVLFGATETFDKNSLNWLMVANGVTELWASVSPDNIGNIDKEDHDALKERYFSDVITVALLEKGVDYIDSLVREVNPTALERAKAINIVDFYMRILLEEEKTQLYVSLRIIQDYLKNNKKEGLEILKKMPFSIRYLAGLQKEKLIDLYNESKHTVLMQYLTKGNITASSLYSLYDLVYKGHYMDLSPQSMVNFVKKTPWVPNSVKNNFFKAVDTHKPKSLRDLYLEQSRNLFLTSA